MAENAHFTSWADLYQQLRNDLASPSFRSMQSYSITAGGGSGNRSVTYRGLTELLSLIEYVKEEANKEEGNVYPGRTYAANRGRG